MKIVVKNSDKLLSTVHGTKVVNEYLVYLFNNNNLPVFAEVTYGTQDRNRVVNKLFKDNFNQTVFELDEVLETITFDKYIAQFKNA